MFAKPDMLTCFALLVSRGDYYWWASQPVSRSSVSQLARNSNWRSIATNRILYLQLAIEQPAVGDFFRKDYFYLFEIRIELRARAESSCLLWSVCLFFIYERLIGHCRWSRLTCPAPRIRLANGDCARRPARQAERRKSSPRSFCVWLEHFIHICFW